MNNQAQSPYSALLNYLLGSQGGSTAKTVNDILAGTGLQNTYNNQVAVGNAATQAQQKIVDNAVNGPVNGYYVNASPMQDSANMGMIRDSSMPVNLLLGILGQASQLQENANNNATQTLGNAGQNQVQNRSLTDQYGGNDPLLNGGSGSSPIDAVNEVIKQGGADLLKGNDAEQYREAQNIIAAGGVGAYRAQNKGSISLTPNETTMLQNINNARQMIFQSQNQLKSSKSLQNHLSNPVSKFLIRKALESGNTQLLEGMGLSAEDVKALQNLDALSSTSVAARSKVKLGLDQSSKQNLSDLSQMLGLLNNDLSTYQKQKGYNAVGDIPYIQKAPLQSLE